jgi:hypothetical protein
MVPVPVCVANEDGLEGNGGGRPDNRRASKIGPFDGERGRCPCKSRPRADVCSNENVSPAAPIHRENQGDIPRLLTEGDRPEVRRWCAGSGVDVSNARVVSGAARGDQRAGTLWWFRPDGAR